METPFVTCYLNTRAGSFMEHLVYAHIWFMSAFFNPWGESVSQPRNILPLKSRIHYLYLLDQAIIRIYVNKKCN